MYKNVEDLALKHYVQEEIISGEVEPSTKKVRRDESLQCIFGDSIEKVTRNNPFQVEFAMYKAAPTIDINGILLYIYLLC